MFCSVQWICKFMSFIFWDFRLLAYTEVLVYQLDYKVVFVVAISCSVLEYLLTHFLIAVMVLEIPKCTLVWCFNWENALIRNLRNASWTYKSLLQFYKKCLLPVFSAVKGLFFMDVWIPPTSSLWTYLC